MHVGYFSYWWPLKKKLGARIIELFAPQFYTALCVWCRLYISIERRKKTKNKQNTHTKKSSYSIISHLGHAYRGQWPGRVKWPVSSRAWMCAQRADCLLTYKNKVSLSLSLLLFRLSFLYLLCVLSIRPFPFGRRQNNELAHYHILTPGACREG